MTSSLWFVVGPWTLLDELFKFLTVCRLDYTAIAGRECWARKPVNHITLGVVVESTDGRESIRKNCVIEHFDGGFFVLFCYFAFLGFLLLILL